MGGHELLAGSLHRRGATRVTRAGGDGAVPLREGQTGARRCGCATWLRQGCCLPVYMDGGEALRLPCGGQQAGTAATWQGAGPPGRQPAPVQHMRRPPRGLHTP